MSPIGHCYTWKTGADTEIEVREPKRKPVEMRRYLFLEKSLNLWSNPEVESDTQIEHLKTSIQRGMPLAPVMRSKS